MRPECFDNLFKVYIIMKTYMFHYGREVLEDERGDQRPQRETEQ